MFDVSYGTLDFDLMLRIFGIMILLPIQLLLCFKAKKRIIRLLPMIIFVILCITFIVLASMSSGWDGLGYIIFAIYAAYMVFICVLGVIIYRVIKYINKNKTKND